MSPFPRALRIPGLLLAGVVLASCSSTTTQPQESSTGSAATEQTTASQTGTVDTSDRVTASPGEDEAAPAVLEPSVPVALPEEHVHGIGVDPGDGAVYLAAHDGLHRYGTDGAEQVGPEIDLMGFAVIGPNHLVGSGHPGPDVDLPNPVGLIESRDGGQTWQSLSRAGESDFHALSATSGRIAGFDGTLRISVDGTTWQDAGLTDPLADVAVSPDGQTLLATTEAGVQRSRDAGVTWSLVPDAPVLVLVQAAGEDTWVGITPQGQLTVSADGADTWEARADVGTQVQAFTAVAGNTPGSPHVLVVDDQGIEHSKDGGRTFITLGGPSAP